MAEIDLNSLPYGLNLIHYPIPEDLVDAYLDAIANSNPFVGTHQYVVFLVLPKGLLSRYALYLYKIQPVQFYRMILERWNPHRAYQEIILTLDPEVTLYYSHEVFLTLFSEFLPDYSVKLESTLLSSWQYRLRISILHRNAVFEL